MEASSLQLQPVAEDTTPYDIVDCKSMVLPLVSYLYASYLANWASLCVVHLCNGN